MSSRQISPDFSGQHNVPSPPIPLPGGGGYDPNIDHLQHKNHNGMIFLLYGNADLNLNDVIEVLVQTDGSAVHFLWNITASDRIEIQFYEGPTFSAAGTAANIVNMKLGDPHPFTTTITTTPTLLTDGTEFFDQVLVTGHKSGGASAPVTEFILQPNTDYLIRITADVNSDAVQYQLYFYEEDV